MCIAAHLCGQTQEVVSPKGDDLQIIYTFGLGAVRAAVIMSRATARMASCRLSVSFCIIAFGFERMVIKRFLP